MIAGPLEAAYARRSAELVAACGVNLQPAQVLAVQAQIGQEEAAREVAVAAYQAGAQFVDVEYFDLEVKRIRADNADPETLAFVPSWYGDRLEATAAAECARIRLAGQSQPSALDGVDSALASRDMLPRLKEHGAIVNSRRSNWSIIPAISGGWARLVFPELPEAEARERLAEELTYVLRLDSPDPQAEWRSRIEELQTMANVVNSSDIDELRFVGDGTDLIVGLLPTSRFVTALETTTSGIDHITNLPTEEIYTSPDPRRVEGTVAATRPLVLGGEVIRDLSVTFASGRVTRVQASQGQTSLEQHLKRDEGASLLGEVALVDKSGRVGRTGMVFYDTLLDENAASHIALGNAYEKAVSPSDADSINRSIIHTDFMIGSEAVDVHARTKHGDWKPLLTEGEWRLGNIS